LVRCTDYRMLEFMLLWFTFMLGAYLLKQFIALEA
jgi:hypothetical protein